MTKIKTKRIPYALWPTIQARYNEKNRTNFSIPTLQQMVRRGNLGLLDLIADVVIEKTQEDASEALRITAKLEKVGLA